MISVLRRAVDVRRCLSITQTRYSTELLSSAVSQHIEQTCVMGSAQERFYSGSSGGNCFLACCPDSNHLDIYLIRMAIAYTPSWVH